MKVIMIDKIRQKQKRFFSSRLRQDNISNYQNNQSFILHSDLSRRSQNYLFHLNVSFTRREKETIRIQLIYVVDKIRNEIRNKSFHEQADLLLITFDTLCNDRSQRDLQHLQLCVLDFDG
jgi:hypothetical protein